MTAAILTQWTIFHGARDYPPGVWVVRAFDVYRQGEPQPRGAAIVRPSLEAARAVIPCECHNIGRQPGDDPVIVEVWV